MVLRMRERLLKSIINNKNRIAYIDDINSFTYEELYMNICKINDFFSRNNITRVALCIEKSFSCYSMILASFISNVTFSVWNSSLPMERINYLIDVYSPDIVICESNLKPDCNCIDIKDIVEKNNYLDEYVIAKIGNSEQAYVLFTSGSTSMPKGCIISNESLNVFIEKMSKIFILTEDDRYGQYAPFYFDMSILDIFIVPIFGATLVPFVTLGSKLRPGKLIHSQRISVINSVPQLYELLARTNQFDFEHLKSIRMIKIGGDIVKIDLIEAIFNVLPDVKILVTYGPTEATVLCMINELSKSNFKEHHNGIIVDLGCNIEGYSEIKIDKDNQIIIEGKCVGLGYLIETSSSEFDTNESGERIYYSGDYVEIIDNKLYFAGRKDEQVKINGNRVSLLEIETVLSRLNCRAAAIVENGCIVLFYESNVYSSEDVRDILLKSIPQYAMPTNIIKIDKIRLNQNDKVDKKYLRDFFRKNYRGET